MSEKSWIAADAGGKPIRLIPWLQEKIAARYPGTKLTMTEYNFGAGDHISGGLAQADALGVFGREGLYLANYWGDGAGNGQLPSYIKAAFQLYRNYDGKGATFGDTAVAATSPRSGQGLGLRRDRFAQHPGDLDRPGHQQGVARDLRWEDRPQRGRLRQSEGLCARRQRRQRRRCPTPR